jgi:hypothetical protein
LRALDKKGTVLHRKKCSRDLSHQNIYECALLIIAERNGVIRRKQNRTLIVSDRELFPSPLGGHPSLVFVLNNDFPEKDHHPILFCLDISAFRPHIRVHHPLERLEIQVLKKFQQKLVVTRSLDVGEIYKEFP